MTDPALRRGWCPTLDRPMQSGDGLLVRVQPPEARLTPAQAHALADAAARHGNGILELTQRGNIQLRGLRADTIDAFQRAMEQAGLPAPGPLLAPPLLGDDPGLAPAAAILDALHHALVTAPALAQLPAKFAIAVDAGGIFADRPVAADLVVRIRPGGATLQPADRTPTPAPAGPLPYAGTPTMAFALAPPFGQLDVPMLHALAGLADRHATTIRVTPWRALLLGRVRAGTRIDAGPAWITDPADRRLLVTACIGAPGCSRATTPTRLHAARIRPARPTHVSGCAKGCAHPAAAPFTLVARDGAYDLVLDGRAADRPIATGIML